MPFEPKGPVAQWRMIYDHCVKLLKNAGTEPELVTWRQWSKILPFDIKRAPTAVRRANKELLEQHGRVLVSVRGEGYKIDVPSARMTLIAQQKKRGLGHFAHAEELATYVPEGLLTPEQAARLALEQRHLMLINNVLARHDRRIGETESSVDRLDARFTGLENRLQQLGYLPRTRDDQVIEGEVVDPQT